MTVDAPAAAEARHANQRLFSDHYLDVRLPARPEWSALTVEAEPVRRAIGEVLGSYTPSANEAQTEDGLIKPVLRLLGHVFEVQAKLATPDGVRTPDYVLYRDAAALAENRGQRLTDERLAGRGLAVADAKFWDRPLDVALRVRGGDAFTNRNPSYQIAFYMQHSGLEWGILTNGRLWRLYHRDTAHKLDRFYQVDLAAAVRAEDPAGFLYFYAFFRRAAFDAGPLGLGALLAASTDYARGVSDSLKRQVYDALRHIAQGFLDHPANGLAVDGARLPEIYDHSLRVLYRLLFLLYAEAGGLLPVRDNAAYGEVYGLKAVKEAVARDLDAGRRPLAGTAVLWSRLVALFGIIDTGSAELGVPAYNGGLFAAKTHPFLAAHAVGDAHLQRAIDKLARVDGQFVDYRDLSVRHLGTIYEGLLEFHLAALEAPEADDGLRWTVALVNDKGERKATGSYYTPDYIVKYMVDRTVRPALEAATAAAADDRARVDAVLALNVLDPAMGSGHFLVEVVEAIARYLVALDVPPESDAGGVGDAPDGGVAGAQGVPREPDVAYWKRRVAQNCVYGVDLNPLAVDLAKLSLWLTTVSRDRPLSFLDHHLRPGNALVGARLDDLVPMAWERGRPDRTGRRKGATADVAAGGAGSTGESASDAAPAPAQLSMLDDAGFRRNLSLAVDAMWLIEGTAGVTVAEVREQEQLYLDLRERLTRRYGRLADLSTATHFGLTVDAELWRPLVDYATGRSLAAPARFGAWLAAAEAFAERHRPFHWELEFPEVFVDRHGRPLGEAGGFDVVIGNPPYIRQEQLAVFKPYLRARYGEVYAGTADLYLYFYARGITLLKQDGRMAFISSGTFARANFAKAFRQWLPTAASIDALVDFGENQPFPGAEMVRPSIVVLRRAPQSGVFRSLFIADKVPESLDEAVDADGVDCAPESLAQPEWTFQAADSTRLFGKIMAVGRPLLDVVEGKMYRGVLTGLNEAFIVDQATRDRLVAEDPACVAVVRKVLRGEDLRPWYQEDEGRWLIFARRGIDIDAFPTIKAHLEQFREQLEPRPADWDLSRPWPGRKPGAYQWYEIQDTVDYYDAFDEPKIFWPDIAKLPRFSWDDYGLFINNKGYIIPHAEPSLLGILQSRVNWFAVSQLCQPLRLRAGLWQFQMFTQFTGRLPIPDAPAADRDAIGNLATAITAIARERYALHTRVRRRIAADLGGPGARLNQKLTAWWGLDFPAFRAQVATALKADIPLKERDAWDAWLAEQRAAHAAHTAEIVRLETDLNRRVYALFDLTGDEVRLVEEATKYRYGEV